MAGTQGAKPKKTSALSIWASPEGALVVVAAGVTAVVASMPIVLVPGALAYGILTLLRWNRSKAVGRQAGVAPVEPALAGLKQPYAQRLVRSVDVQRGILQEIASASEEHKALLAATGERVRGLVEVLTKLVAQLQELDRHLSLTSPEDLERAAQELERRVQGAKDPAARGGFARALEQQRQKAQLFGELAARRERLEAQVVNVEITLETVGTQVARVKSADATAASAEGVRIEEMLDALAIDADAVAETVDDAASAYERAALR